MFITWRNCGTECYLQDAHADIHGKHYNEAGGEEGHSSNKDV